MATITIYGNTSDGMILSQNVTYSVARTGGDKTVYTTSNLQVGQNFVASSYYEIHEFFTEYDTSAIAGMTVTAALERLTLLNDYSTTDFVDEVRAYNWGGSLTTADWIAGENLGNYPQIIEKNTNTITSGANDFVIDEFLSNFITQINSLGKASFVHSSRNHRNNAAPTGIQSVVWRSADAAGTTNDPRLIIEYETAATELSGTLTGTGDMTGTLRVLRYLSGTLTGAGDMSGTLRVLMYSHFLGAPTVTVRTPVATHVTVRSPTHSYTAHITPEPPVGTKIERIEEVSAGDAAVCQSVAEALIARWGRTQLSVEGAIPLDLRLRFKQKLHVTIPQAGIDGVMVLQRKEHDVFAGTTAVTLGDIILDDSELIARILQDLTNK